VKKTCDENTTASRYKSKEKLHLRLAATLAVLFSEINFDSKRALLLIYKASKCEQL
jgi:hypothetical protein